jgi:DNA-directed RNA polymerase specialized sigma24 family protein
MGKSKPSIPPTRLSLLPAGPLPFTASHAVGSEIAGGRTEDANTTDETPEPPAEYLRMMQEQLRDQQKQEASALPIDKQEAFQRFTMGLPMNIHHVAAVAGISIHGVANAVHRGRLRRRSMQAEAGFHPDDVRAWVWGPAERVGG